MAKLSFVPRLMNSILKRVGPPNKKYMILSYVDSEVDYFLKWKDFEFKPPAPNFIKRKTLIRHGIPNSTWIETGTCYGDTTALLAEFAPLVYSIEPKNELFENAKIRFKDYDNVNLINDVSENVIGELLENISGDVTFWLDGHYSGVETFQGDNDTPIMEELQVIGKNINKFDKIVIAIDDIRCFLKNDDSYMSYPRLDEVVAWVQKYNLNWCIEHDILIAKNFKY